MHNDTVRGFMNKMLLLWAAASLCFVNVIKENNYAAGDSYQPH